MSLLSSERRAGESAGIAIGRDYVVSARVARSSREQVAVRNLTHCRLEAPLFLGIPQSSHRAELLRAIASAAGELRDRYLPVHVSLPDAAVRIVVMELEQLPANPRTVDKLVEFRLARDDARPSQRNAWQVLGRAHERHLLLAMRMDSTWLDLVLEALDAAGIVPWSVATNGTHHFNRFAAATEGSAGALVTVAPDAWSLWIWDANGWPRHVRAQWRSGTEGDLLVEVRRSIVAYAEGSGQAIERVLLACSDDEEDTLAGSIDRNLRKPCVRLPCMSGLTAAHGVELGARAKGAALAAALGR